MSAWEEIGSIETWGRDADVEERTRDVNDLNFPRGLYRQGSRVRIYMCHTNTDGIELITRITVGIMRIEV